MYGAGSGMRRSSPRCRIPGDVYATIWRGAANELGAEVIELGAGLLEIRKDGDWTRVRRQLTMLDDAVTLQLALQKPIVQNLLLAAGLPAPDNIEFDASDLAPALAFLTAGPIPCVVKPGNEGAGFGITTGIRTEADLMRARLRAARVDR